MRRALLIALLLLATACSTPATSTDTAGGSEATSTSTATGAPADDGIAGSSEALAFTASTVTGAAFDGGEYAGKDLMLWFWAPW